MLGCDLQARTTCEPTEPADRATGAVGSATAQQGEEHRVGAVPVRPQLRRPARRRACRPTTRGRRDRAGQHRPGVQLLDVVAPAQHVGHHQPGLGRVRRAGHVGDQRRPGGPRRAPTPSSSRCSRRQRGEVAGLPPPARLGPAAQRAQPGARRVDQHPVVRRGLAGDRPRRPSPVRTCTASPGWPPPGGPARPGARPTSLATSCAPRSAASAPSSAALPPGPAHRSSQRSSAPLERGRRPAPARPAGCPRPARRRGPRRTAGECARSALRHNGVRRPAPRRAPARRRAARRPSPARAGRTRSPRRPTLSAVRS